MSWNQKNNFRSFILFASSFSCAVDAPTGERRKRSWHEKFFWHFYKLSNERQKLNSSGKRSLEVIFMNSRGKALTLFTPTSPFALLILLYPRSDANWRALLYVITQRFSSARQEALATIFVEYFLYRQSSEGNLIFFNVPFCLPSRLNSYPHANASVCVHHKNIIWVILGFKYFYDFSWRKRAGKG